MEALQPELWRRTRDRKCACLNFNPVMYMQIGELVLVGRMGALQPELWWWHQ